MTESQPSRRRPAEPSPSNPAFSAYAQAAGWGCLLEVRMRLLADNTPALRRFAHEYKLEDVETEIIKTFSNDLSREEADRFGECRRLRNKILHCDFREARDRLVRMGGTVRANGVWMASFGDSENRKPPVRVSETTTEDGTVYGWVLECAQTGIFDEAKRVFRETIEIVDSLIQLSGEMGDR